MRHYVVRFLFLFLVSKVAQAELLLVVGDVGTNQARILYEPFNHQGMTVNYTVSEIKTKKQLTHSNLEINTNFPNILVVHNLTQNTRYQVVFDNPEHTQSNQLSNVVEFTTFSEDQLELNLNVVSCNRYIEDRDPGMWEIVTEKHKIKPQQATIHLGDQIYGDNIPYEFINHFKNLTNENLCVKYQTLLEAFRNYYRITWMNPAMFSTLRQGGNWMIPDDHELLNNANPDFWKARILPKRVSNSKNYLKYLMRAGLQVFYEYQYQLHSNLPGDFSFVENLCISVDDEKELEIAEQKMWEKYDRILFSKPFYFSRKIGKNVLLFVDTRYQKNFHFDSHHLWLGMDQFNEIENQIKLAENQKDLNKILIFSAIPFFYCSEFASDVAYLVEGEKYGTHLDLQHDLSILLALLFRSSVPSNKIVLFSGDLHLYFDSDICDYKSGKCIKQLCTSGVSESSTALHSIPIYWFYILALKLSTPVLITSDFYFYLRFNDVFLWNNFIQFSTKSLETGFNFLPVFRPLDSPVDILLMNFFTYFWLIISILFSLILVFMSLIFRDKTPSDHQ